MSQLSSLKMLKLILLGGEIRFNSYPRWTLHFRRHAGLLFLAAFSLAVFFEWIRILTGAGSWGFLALLRPTRFQADPVLEGLQGELFTFSLMMAHLFLGSLLVSCFLLSLTLILLNLNHFTKRRFRFLSIIDVQIASVLPWQN